MTAKEALRVWGIYAEFGRLRSVGHKHGSGGASGYDYAQIVYLHVEKYFATNEWICKPLFLFVESGAEPKNFIWRGPGETKSRALLRLRWWKYQDVADIPGAAYAGELEHFSQWLMVHPVPDEMPEYTDFVVYTDGEREQLETQSRNRPLTTRDAASYLGKSVGAVEKLVSRGQIIGNKVRGCWMTTWGAVWDYRDSRNVRRAG